MKLERLHRIRQMGPTFEVHRSEPGATKQVREAIDRRIAKIDRALDQAASRSRRADDLLSEPEELPRPAPDPPARATPSPPIPDVPFHPRPGESRWAVQGLWDHGPGTAEEEPRPETRIPPSPLG